MKADLYQIADELRALANLGLRFSRDEYDRERYQKVLAASARVVAALEGESADHILAQYAGNFDHVSPLGGAEVALFYQDKILLIKRHDDGLWAVPGGLVEVGETAAETAQRELWEETGIQAEILGLLGVFDSRIWKSRTSMQLFHFVFLADAIDPIPHTSSEAVEVGFFSESELPPLSPGHHLRVPYYFQQIRGAAPLPHFDAASA